MALQTSVMPLTTAVAPSRKLSSGSQTAHSLSPNSCSRSTQPFKHLPKKGLIIERDQLTRVHFKHWKPIYLPFAPAKSVSPALTNLLLSLTSVFTASFEPSGTSWGPSKVSFTHLQPILQVQMSKLCTHALAENKSSSIMISVLRLHAHSIRGVVLDRSTCWVGS